MVRAIISLPDPVSPAMSTAAGWRATFSASFITRCKEGLRMINSESPPDETPLVAFSSSGMLVNGGPIGG
jgi:hypothetical protein